MNFRITNHESRITKRGSTLLLTLIFMVGLMGFVMAYLSMLSYDTRNAGGQENNVKAFYLAEAGLNKAVWYLKNTAPDGSTDGSWRTTAYPAEPGAGGTDPKQEMLGEGTYTIWVEDSGDDVIIKAQGEVNSVMRLIQQTVTVSGGAGVIEAFTYASFAGGDIDFSSSNNGTVTGDVGAQGNIDDADVTVNGDSMENSSVDIPTVDYAAYEGIADNVIEGNKIFAKKSTSTGIWYVKGNVEIRGNAVINGTIIAEGNISFTDNGGTVTAASPYPALVAQGNISSNSKNNITITGAIFSEGNFVFNSSNNFTFLGSMVVGGDIGLSDSNNFDITFDTSDPPYFTGDEVGGGELSVDSVINSWGEM